MHGINSCTHGLAQHMSQVLWLFSFLRFRVRFVCIQVVCPCGPAGCAFLFLKATQSLNFSTSSWLPGSRCSVLTLALALVNVEKTNGKSPLQGPTYTASAYQTGWRLECHSRRRRQSRRHLLLESEAMPNNNLQPTVPTALTPWLAFAAEGAEASPPNLCDRYCAGPVMQRTFDSLSQHKAATSTLLYSTLLVCRF